MNELMPQIYDDLISLCSKNIGFYSKVVTLDEIKYRIFNYNLCSYEQFQNFPSALNCRGIMFNINDHENIQLVCLPLEKFFNYEEGNGCQVHLLGELGVQMEKLDGSLISTYLHKINDNTETIRLKSKTSLTSSQAVEAMKLLTGEFRDEIEEIVRHNYTVNMEYTSPFNQIVLHYPDSKLSVLSIRSHLTGETLFGDKLVLFLKENNYLTILQNLVSYKKLSNELTQKELVENIRKETKGEGYVIEIINPNKKSYLIKIKTEKYLLLHRTKFDCTSYRYLFQCVINEQTDDLRSLYQNENEVLQRIKNMEEQVRPIYNNIIQNVELFYEENKKLSRKEYAIKATNTNNMKIYMPLIMNLYSGKENDYKKFSISHMNDIFNIKDDTNTFATTTTTNIDQEQ